MPLFDAVKEFTLADQYRIPTAIKERLKRGREEMLRDATKRRLCARFERGETYWYLDNRLQLQLQSTVTAVGAKPPYRIRNQYNFIRPIVEGKVSASTQRIPGYEVLPTSTDPEKWAAAKLSEQVARYGYYKWNLRNVRIRVIKNAIAGGGEGFAMPYFDPDVGPYRRVQNPETGELETVGEGELKVKTFNGNEVYWEPGVQFEDSPWWATEQACSIEQIRAIPGYFESKLVPDAQGSDIPNDTPQSNNLVMVTEYYERPSLKNPRGRKVCIANGRIIAPVEDYPLIDSTGRVLDEPVIHRLVYTHDADGKRDLGLVWQLIDFQRTAQDCYNKLLEYKNRGLRPRMKAPVGSLLARPTDEPGGIDWYRPVGGMQPEWETPLQVPPALFSILELTKADMRAVASDEQVDAAPDLAAKTVQQVIATSQARWAAFLGDVAEFDGRLMHHMLLLVARHYTEPRLLSIRGRFAPAPIADFRGAMLMDQQDVIVQPQSLEVTTKQAQQNMIFAYADRQWISPQAAMFAMDGRAGTDELIQSYELDIARIDRIIQRIRDGTVLDMPPRAQEDPLTGQPVVDPMTGQVLTIPGWMPDIQDDPVVWQARLSDWMKTEEYEQIDPPSQEIARHMLEGMQQLDAQKQMQAAAAQQMQAEKLGMDNASKPARAAPNPSMRSPGGATSSGSSHQAPNPGKPHQP